MTGTQLKPSSNRKQPVVDALLLAAGSGKRMGSAGQGGNKVLLPLMGHPILWYSLVSLLKCEEIRRIVLVHRSIDQDEITKTLSSCTPDKEILVCEGGNERSDSVFNGLEALSGQPPEVVLIHDSARPFFTREMVASSIELAQINGAATVAIPLTDTLKRGRDGFLNETLPRKELFRIQTPQAFQYDLIREAHQIFRSNPDPGVTDDCMLLEKKGMKIALVAGDERNLKITTALDLLVAEMTLSQGKKEGSQPYPFYTR